MGYDRQHTRLNMLCELSLLLAYAAISLCTNRNALEFFDGITNEWWLVLDWYRIGVHLVYSRRLDPEDSA
jgi:hypothetical protein